MAAHAIVLILVAFSAISGWSQPIPEVNRREAQLDLSQHPARPFSLTKAWSIRTSTPASGLVGDDTTCLAFSQLDSTIYNLNPIDGKIRWQTRPFLGALSAPTKWDGQVLVIPNSSVLQSLDERTGEITWQVPFVSKSLRHADPGEIYSSFNPPLTSPKEVLWLDSLGQLWSLNSAHQLRVVADFRNSSGDSSRYLSQPTLVNAALVACSQRGTLTSVNLKTGKSSLIGSLRQAASGLSGKLSITTHPQAVGSRIIIGSEDGTLFGYLPNDPKNSWVKTFGRGSDTFSAQGDLVFRPLLLSREPQTKNPGIVLALRHRIERVNADRGDRVWSIPIKESLLYPPALGPNQSIVVATSSELLILDWNGVIVRQAAITADLCAAPMVQNDAVFLAYKDGTICRYNL